MKLSKAADILGSHYDGKDVEFSAISIDTRMLKVGDLFLALKGEHFDGHDFVNEALNKGACGVVVDRPMCNAPAIEVRNTLEALGKLAHYYRSQVSTQIIAITGSCGKTTTRVLAQNIFSQEAKTLASARSFNNEIGVPLTLFNLTKEHQYAVLEVGANHVSEISRIMKIMEPVDVAVITTIAPVHVEGFGSLNNIAKAKFEIVEGLKSDGILVLSYADYQRYWKDEHQHKILTFGLNDLADIHAINIQLNEKGCPHFHLKTPQGECEIQLHLIGKHNVYNALAAVAVAIAKNISLEKIKKGLKETQPVENRLTVQKGFNGALIIDDTYNANPLAMQASIDLLVHYPGKHILVMGDMLELGQEGKTFHEEIGVYAKGKGVDALFAYGKLSRFASSNFGKNAYHFESREALIKALKPKLNKETVVLVKASHGMKFQEIVEEIL